MEPCCMAILVAVLWKGQVAEFDEDSALVDWFHQAYEKFGGHDGFWREFRRHPQYQNCRNLHDTIATMTLGSALVRTSLSHHLRTSAAILGDYGQKKYESLPLALQQQIDEMVSWRQTPSLAA
jgi:hypothetical protein